MNEQELKTRINEAWKAHYAGQHDVAIERFKQIVTEVPDHIDAYWGLGLAYRTQGQRDNALQIFRKVKDLLATKVDAESDDRGRYVMLSRMVSQQIEQMADFI
jgi:tetratricopeptide (TPR) repeat protein